VVSGQIEIGIRVAARPEAEAVFPFLAAGVGLAKKRPGRHRDPDLKRSASGKAKSSNFRDWNTKDPGTAYTVAQRQLTGRPDIGERLLAALNEFAVLTYRLSDSTLHPAERNRVKNRLNELSALITTAQGSSKDQRLSYPLGVLYARGDLARAGDPGIPEPADADDDPVARRAYALHQAGLYYAGLHCAFWGGLRQDVAEALSPEDVRELEGVGRTGIQRRRIPSHLSKIVVSIVGTEDYQDTAEREKRRTGIAARLWEARKAMGVCVMAVDHVVIDEIPPGWPKDGAGAWQMNDIFRARLIRGLGALVEFFHLEDDGRRPRIRAWRPPEG